MSDFVRQRRPSHPGSILRTHYLEPRAIGVGELAAALDINRKHMSQVLNGHKRIEPTLAARLAKALETTVQFWLNLQASVDASDAATATKDWQPHRKFPPPASAEA